MEQQMLIVENEPSGTAVHTPVEPIIDISDVPIQVPVNVCGDAISVVGESGSGCGG
jgi:hypothetical protein